MYALCTMCAGACSTASRKTGAAFTPQASRSPIINPRPWNLVAARPSHVADAAGARDDRGVGRPPRHRRMPEARQHVSSVGYLSTLMTTSTHANPTNSTDASRFEEGGAGGFGAASKASGLGHVPFVPLSGGARAKYSTKGCWFRAEPIAVFGSTSSRGIVALAAGPAPSVFVVCARHEPARPAAPGHPRQHELCVAVRCGKGFARQRASCGPINDNWLRVTYGPYCKFRAFCAACASVYMPPGISAFLALHAKKGGYRLTEGRSHR